MERCWQRAWIKRPAPYFCLRIHVRHSWPPLLFNKFRSSVMSLSARPWNELLSLFVFISVIFMKFACAFRLYKWHRMNFHMQPFFVFVRGGCMHMHMGLYLYKAPHIQFISNIVLYMKWSMKPHAGSAPDRNTRSWCGHCICRRKRKMYGLCFSPAHSSLLLKWYFQNICLFGFAVPLWVLDAFQLLKPSDCQT